jgi:anti-anti-sigma factor
MPFTSEISGGLVTIRLHGRLTYSTHPELRAAVMPFIGEASVNTIRLDLEEVSFLDSSTIGVFLLFREQAWVVHKALVVINANPSVLSVLKMLRLEELFETGD